jgi:hypothetical protein
MRSPFWPFTGVLQEIRREVMRKMQEDRRVSLLREQGLSVPTPNPNPTITIQNKPKLRRTICHFVRSLRGLQTRISAGTAVAHLCKLFEELV